MSQANQTEMLDVKDIRQNFQKEKNNNKLKKTFLFGYDIKKTDSYIASVESTRELEKNALLARLKELETVIKSFDAEKEALEGALKDSQSRLQELERKNEAEARELAQTLTRMNEYEALIASYEEELKKREDAVALLENASLKKCLAEVTEERNQYAGQCEIYKNENELYQKQNELLEAEADRLSEKLAHETETFREQMAELSLQVSKIMESNRFFCERTLQDIEMLLSSNQKYKAETETLAAALKEKLALINCANFTK